MNSNEYEKKVAAKMNYPTSLDPHPNRESAELRVAAGEASKFYANLKKEARRLGYKIKARNGFEWDTLRVRIETEPELAANIASGMGNYSEHHRQLARAATAK